MQIPSEDAIFLWPFSLDCPTVTHGVARLGRCRTGHGVGHADGQCARVSVSQQLAADNCSARRRQATCLGMCSCLVGLGALALGPIRKAAVRAAIAAGCDHVARHRPRFFGEGDQPYQLPVGPCRVRRDRQTRVALERMGGHRWGTGKMLSCRTRLGGILVRGRVLRAAQRPAPLCKGLVDCRPGKRPCAGPSAAVSRCPFHEPHSVDRMDLLDDRMDRRPIVLTVR